jgi:NADPH-dependent 2,4-dienoyl-CoA reductase/sulfur reductase-like enzyme
VVVGASLAGFRAAEALRAEGFDGRLELLGEEPHLPYDRPPLSKDLLKGKVEPDRVQLRKVEQLEAEWRLGDPAISLDLGTRTVRTAGGEEVAFDGLVIATGSTPRRLPALDPSATASSSCAPWTTPWRCARCFVPAGVWSSSARDSSASKWRRPLASSARRSRWSPFCRLWPSRVSPSSRTPPAACWPTA